IRDFHVTGVQTCVFRSGYLRRNKNYTPLGKGFTPVVSTQWMSTPKSLVTLSDSLIIQINQILFPTYLKSPKTLTDFSPLQSKLRSEERRVGCERRLR